MVEIFKTNVEFIEQSIFISAQLLKQFPNLRINFDLDDCDKILRVETGTGKTKIESIINILTVHGFECENLPILL